MTEHSFRTRDEQKVNRIKKLYLEMVEAGLYDDILRHDKTMTASGMAYNIIPVDRQFIITMYPILSKDSVIVFGQCRCGEVTICNEDKISVIEEHQGVNLELTFHHILARLNNFYLIPKGTEK